MLAILESFSKIGLKTNYLWAHTSFHTKYEIKNVSIYGNFYQLVLEIDVLDRS